MNYSKQLVMTKEMTKKQPAIISKLVAVFNRQVKNFEDKRFALMTIFLTAQSCLGSIACMFILQSNETSYVMLPACAAITMAANSVFIAQCDGRICLSAFYLSLLSNTIFILVNL